MATSAWNLPVLWKDVSDGGLKGVLDVHKDDFPGTNRREPRVRDFIAALNKKMRDTPAWSNSLRVESILLYGTRVQETRLLESIIPELEGSSPRIVATVRAWSSQSGIAMEIFVKTPKSKTLAITCASTDTILSIKRRVQVCEGIPRENQRLVYAGKHLENYRTLSEYRVESGSTLCLSLRLRGGRDIRNVQELTQRRRVTFADVSNKSLLTEIEFGTDGPDWLTACKGLNIEGRCENPSCAAFKQDVIHMNHFDSFNLLRDENVKCPECYSKVKPLTCGFNDCAWKFEGVRADDGCSVCSPWKNATGGKYHCFAAGEGYGSIEWESMLIMVKPREESNRARLFSSGRSITARTNNICSICWSELDSSSVHTGQCGHQFHHSCVSNLSIWRKNRGMLPTCPVCRADLSLIFTEEYATTMNRFEHVNGGGNYEAGW